MLGGILSLYKKLQKTIEWFKRYSNKAILGIFCPIWAKKEIFKKNYCIILNVLWYSIFIQKKIQKTVKRLKDIAITRIEQSDWSRALESISREPIFSQTWGFRKKLDNNKTLRFRQFLVKLITQFCTKVQKPYFLVLLGQTRFFCHFSTFMNL